MTTVQTYRLEWQNNDAKVRNYFTTTFELEVVILPQSSPNDPERFVKSIELQYIDDPDTGYLVDFSPLTSSDGAYTITDQRTIGGNMGAGISGTQPAVNLSLSWNEQIIVQRQIPYWTVAAFSENSKTPQNENTPENENTLEENSKTQKWIWRTTIPNDNSPIPFNPLPPTFNTCFSVCVSIKHLAQPPQNPDNIAQTPEQSHGSVNHELPSERDRASEPPAIDSSDNDTTIASVRTESSQAPASADAEVKKLADAVKKLCANRLKFKLKGVEENRFREIDEDTISIQDSLNWLSSNVRKGGTGVSAAPLYFSEHLLRDYEPAQIFFRGSHSQQQYFGIGAKIGERVSSEATGSSQQQPPPPMIQFNA
ncbi:hypothetical protein V1509DRAFT_640168 [Lipomyces kononenkoae]